MSLILDALNRADRERKNSQPTPDINTVHEATYRPERSRLPRLWIVGSLLLVAVLILLVYLLLQTRHEPSHSTASGTGVQVVESAPPPVASRSNSEMVNRADPAPARDAVPPDSARPASGPPDAESAPPEAKNVAEPEVRSLYAEPSEPVVDDKVNDLYKPVEEPPVVESVPVQVPDVTSVSLLDQAREATPAPAAKTPANSTTPTDSTRNYDAIHNVQDLRQLPWSLQQEIPSIIYSQHNFSGDGASNVVLNGQPRRVGNQVGGQLSLEEIFVDGVVLRFREHRFKLRALNNWVNM